MSGTLPGSRIVGPVKPRPALLIRWEELSIGVQVVSAFVVTFIVLVIIHLELLNQPLGRSLTYGVFWAVLATAALVGGTRSERARRLREQAAHEGRTRPRGR